MIDARLSASFLFYINDQVTAEIYTLSLHDALPIYHRRVEVLDGVLEASERDGIGDVARGAHDEEVAERFVEDDLIALGRDRKSTRLNSSHLGISYAVFCLKKKINTNQQKYNHARVQ